MVAMEELLPQAVLRQIGDKLYEKRKVAALEVEQIVKRLAAVGDTAKISAILDKLIAEYAFSAQANHRKVRCMGGGLQQIVCVQQLMNVCICAA
jgi:vacuole morphology and inheritance protein 14